ncbi:hypothetical protein, conserved [Eimeria tenella]|uniref:Uncharacterized protein n=1 Tax=Eimeria tenella TaxID=5802 RepID=U6KV84_EIMTE|nr:hypothetical protein, conserved [Eimeria tenella]CDJ42027.1 hypothetical protein, conserved [Eimeria tenella]|eukprot:XP_013232777.1 hypothetical protein, conserved [Eimeria tenella]
MVAAFHSPSGECRRLAISLKGGALKCLVLGALAILCLLQVVSCVRHPETSQLEVGEPGDVPFHMGGFDGEMHEEVSRLMQHQLAQLERQEALEAIAEPYLHRKPAGQASMLLQAARGKATYGVPPEGPMNSMMDFGSLLAGQPQDIAEMNPGVSTQLAGMDELGGSMTVDRAPYSFLNWGQIGGMMQNPALAHTGMPVYMPRQVVGTTVGLDFDSPATFHGPLLVLLMVCILIFFVVMLLCCWMVKSKRKHDKYMAEKLPR